ncbi:hypothetical protein ABB37_06409 [Leptomonas pyrrhocoris]|uniref:Programmed cell death protein 2 C-terminal domain-containing protein n=1 Tax=Leptomonas pyrrhocoris TaxID=157538 RepID=A0A0M9FY09_LEPPY|nr:hypothetical protein ABB37_06409 [Leptomonas pyrrhocoris]KPA78257.1 hypothetical protein ABB37_06409 [Leptomonas pyrrhocoris]|eukprot:XP_015656696.1 hypothetical protein ABB37_06409 [Leptomonas pyrrhocoris]
MPASPTTAAVQTGTTHVLLGLFDGYMSLKRDSLTSETKIGGTATYFPPLTETDKSTIHRWTTCGVCGHAMSLLLQAYSPLPGAPTDVPHHRMVYVFACNSSYCARQPLSSMVAFSVQVDAEDTLALEEEEGEAADEDDVVETGPLLPSELPDAVLPPGYVYIDEEPLKETVVPTDLERELIKMAEENARSTVTDEELQQLEQQVDLKDKKTDYYFEKFRARMARAPNQVLRYYERRAATTASTPPASGNTRVKEAKPIFMNPDKVKAMVTIPACAVCGAAQTAELQVMPTTLYYLQVAQYTALARRAAVPNRTNAGDTTTTEQSSGGSSPATEKKDKTTPKSTPGNADGGCDFGTITVYVCSKDCAARQRGVVLRKETLCVEEAPTVRDELLAEKEAEASGAPRKKTLRELLHGDGDDADDEEEEENAEVA